ncbi:hypothetical protein E4U09_007258 [Claviceps aff. purpurea]|uniref:Uncharacterized protein n=1 Tax=Claviceps aff. purpurea TaxID=1967640 RepID=A0A9P7QBT9_9HYPO|nr:hypothetical protein E4U09_007258 [Claviceps aff. purpurea]
MPSNKNKSNIGHNITKKPRERKRHSRKALTDIGINELNALSIVDPSSPGKIQKIPTQALNKPKKINKRVHDIEISKSPEVNKSGKRPRTDKDTLAPGSVENVDPSKPNDAGTHDESQNTPVEESAALEQAVKRNKKHKKTKSPKPTRNGSASTHPPTRPNKVVKPGFKAKLTKRGKRLAAVSDDQQNQMVGEGLLSNGKHLVFRPPSTKKEIDEGAMIEIVMDSLEGGGVIPERVSPVKANVWAVTFTTTNDAMACAGKVIKFGIKDGCTSPVEVQLEKYLTSGPRIFICERQGPITNSEAQQLISSAEFLSDNKFWYGTYKRRGVEGAKRVLVLETPPEVTTMAFSGPNEYELRFRPENRKGKCELCSWPENKDHITLACEYLAGTTVPENMAMRLKELPEMITRFFPIERSLQMDGDGGYRYRGPTGS